MHNSSSHVFLGTRLHLIPSLVPSFISFLYWHLALSFFGSQALLAAGASANGRSAAGASPLWLARKLAALQQHETREARGHAEGSCEGVVINSEYAGPACAESANGSVADESEDRSLLPGEEAEGMDASLMTGSFMPSLGDVSDAVACEGAADTGVSDDPARALSPQGELVEGEGAPEQVEEDEPTNEACERAEGGSDEPASRDADILPQDALPPAALPAACSTSAQERTDSTREAEVEYPPLEPSVSLSDLPSWREDCDYPRERSAHDVLSELLLDFDAEIDACVCGGATLLYLAAQEGDLSGVRWLLLEGALPDAHSLDGATPLQVCCQHAQLHVAKLLLQYAADPNPFGEAYCCGFPPLHLVASLQHEVSSVSVEIVEALLQARGNILPRLIV